MRRGFILTINAKSQALLTLDFRGFNRQRLLIVSVKSGTEPTLICA